MARRRKKVAGAVASLAGLGRVTSGLDGWKPATKALHKVRAVPTIFPGFDLGTGVGGLPLQRFILVHGDSAHGKTKFSLGLGLGFLLRRGIFALIDAEHTTPEDWLVELMGEHADSPGFIAKRPETYEDAVDSVRELCFGIKKGKRDGLIPEDTPALIVVDSINKLMPEVILDKLEKGTGEGGVDGYSGRSAQVKAAYNKRWLDELVPLIYHSNATALFIAREIDNPDGGAFKVDYKVSGGRALNFESSLSCRVARAKWIKDGKDGPVIGERHRVRIHKTKVAGKDDKVVDTYFNTSNGVATPAGFDHARDVLEVCVELRVVKKEKNANYVWASQGEVLGRGENATAKKLAADPKTVSALEEELRARMNEKRKPPGE